MRGNLLNDRRRRWSNAARSRRQTRFVEVCRQNDINFARRTRTRRTMVNLRHPDTHRTALEEAVRQGSTAMVNYLVNEVGVDLEERSRANGRCTPLMIAATCNFVDIARILVQAKASVTVLNDNECTLFHKVELSLQMAMLLCPYGAAQVINTRNHRGCLPVMRAITVNHLEKTMYYVSEGSDLEATNNRGLTAQGLAQDLGHNEIAHCLNSVRDILPDLQRAKAKCILAYHQYGHHHRHHGQDWLVHMDNILELLSLRALDAFDEFPREVLCILAECICEYLRRGLDPLDLAAT